MNSKQIKVRALGLCSGGLDSMLAGLILRKQGVEVVWITFETPFFSSLKAKKASETTSIPLIVQDITQDYLPILKNPPAGYGKWMNPCMDCHALMFRLAGKQLKDGKFHFLFSGEVLGQRPMSQTKSSLRYVEKNSGVEGYILRPLSAKRLPETIPEKKRWVDREQLYDFAGRSRKPQIELARQFGITGYPSPAGGCLLTDKGYSKRLKDLLEHQETVQESELHLLKYGRHFRLKNNTKVIVGRTKPDNQHIVKYYNPAADTLIKVLRIPGPIILIPHGAAPSTIRWIASLCVGYSKTSNETPVDVLVKSPEGKRIIKSSGISPEQIRQWMI
ncbi:MAG: tRNA 4-thiouridine(8) synthase ThiI [Deltaproteobacteria bacterium]|nr:tRNA 4-thiouridine(8) synthase ThiI [Deltaproteobacteria bacterium]MBW1961235.1 tRNA 4-thiouridine(8) synthase ThiI [Deltaproteobacteria bacterium]MBW1994329.1 tRNA 4-thiouridine(8) synthase ThiI [Deltaproteobacteria bacterium]MBW2151686.1 tRNA 4-thiouridine(8) synthase ThiI [Deltaproteobacteria bacterium]